MSHLTLVKNTVNDTETGTNRKERMTVDEFIAAGCPKSVIQPKNIGINSILRNWGKEMKSIARREIIQIKNCKGLSEGKKRLYNKAMKAFQIFADADDVRSESKEMQSIAYDILLYYVDGLNPDISIELDVKNDIVILSRDSSDRNQYLIGYLLNTWETFSRHFVVTGYSIMMAFIDND